jgi:hypothetical protein
LGFWFTALAWITIMGTIAVIPIQPTSGIIKPCQRSTIHG